MSSDPRSIIRKVLITEKGTELRETLRQYYFQVARDANKIEIKRAVEAVFGVKVDSVQTMHMQGKLKRQGSIPFCQLECTKEKSSPFSATTKRP